MSQLARVVTLVVFLVGLLTLQGESRSPSAQAAHEPVPTGAVVESLQTAGERVYMSGVQNGAAKFAWTENILVASPVWTANNAGLPTSSVGSATFAVDPNDPANAGWMVVNGNSVYRNTNLRGGGNWSLIYDVARHNLNTGHSDGGIDSVKLRTTRAVAGFVAWRLHHGPLTGDYWAIVHSHDGGTGQTEIAQPRLVPGQFGDYENLDFVIGHHDTAPVLNALGRDGGYGVESHRSSDGGHTWSLMAGQAGANSTTVYIPFGDNANDLTFLRWVGNGVLERSTDGGATWANWSTQTFPQDAALEITQASAGGIGIHGNGTAALRSNDGGQTWLSATAPGTIVALSLLQEGTYYACGNTDGQEAMTSPDWVGFTNRVGDLHAVLGANPDCHTIVPDPTVPAPPPADLFNSYASAPGQQTAADPTNVVFGNYLHQQRDLIVPGRGVPLALERSYNSLDTSDIGFGAGWSHAFGMSVTAETGSATVRMEDGRRDKYTDTGGGIYTPPTGVHNRLVKNGDNTWTLTKLNQVVYSLDTAGKLTSVRDRNNNTTALSYDASNRLTTITDPGGRSLAFAYDANNRISEVTDPLSRTVQYGYSAGGDLTSVTDVRGGVTTMTYDAGHRLLTLVDPLTRTVLQNTYDGSGRVTQQRDGRNNLTTFAYDTVNRRTTVTDPRNNATVYEYDANKRVTKETDALGNFAQYTYDADSNRTAVRDRRGNTINYTYDANGNVLNITDPVNKTTTFTYNARNDPLTKTDALNRTTAFAYNAAGNLTTITDALNKVTNFAYDAAGNLLTTTDANNKTTTFAYDTYGNRTSITDPLNKVTTQAFDLGGRMTSRTDPLNHTTTFGYNAANQLTSTTDALNHATAFTYDLVGNKTSVTDANGKVTQYQYDGNNNLTKVIDALLQETTYAYDAANNRSAMTNAESPPRTTSYTYDAVNRLAAVTDPLGNATTYGYDLNGNRTSLLDANGQTTTFAYDANERLTTITYPAGQGTVTYAYDDVGNRTQMVDPTGTTTYTYDALYRLTSATSPGPRTVGYGYDNVGNGLTLTYHDGKVATYTYDAANRLASVRDWDNRTTTYAYDDAGRLTTTTYPNGTSATHAYDNADRLTSIVNQKGAATITSHTYTLDSVGSRTQAAENIGTSAYAYDNLYRLTTVTYPGPSVVSYTYSPTGNRLSKVEGSATNYTYDAADRMTAAGGVTYGYDANGNQTSRGGDTFTYDAANRLRSVRIGNQTTTYVYNGDGVRVQKQVQGPDTDYVVDTNRSLPVVLYDGSAWYLYGLDLIARITSGGPAADRQRYYHYDGLGSVRAVSDANGNTDATYNYDAFGAVRSSTGSITNDFQYTGEQRDGESSYYFLRARYYDPTVGRFVSRDPFGGILEDPQTLNSYVYASNNPATLVDPSGLVSAPPFPFLKQSTSAFNLTNVLRYCRSLLEACFGRAKPPVGPTGGKAGAVSAPGARTVTQVETHHLLPKQYADNFRRAGLDIERFTIEMPKDTHRLKPEGLHTGPGSESWNGQWKQFFAANPEPRPEQILSQLDTMMQQFGLR